MRTGAAAPVDAVRLHQLWVARWTQPSCATTLHKKRSQTWLSMCGGCGDGSGCGGCGGCGGSGGCGTDDVI